MDFFKVKRFRKAHKPDPEKELDNMPVPTPEEMKIESGDDLSKSDKTDPASEIEEDDDDDDFILNEVKRRMKELRRNTFMVLIPEESCPEEEEEEETSSSGFRGSEVEDCPQWCRFDAHYDKYCERMLFFDRLSAQRLQEQGKKVIELCCRNCNPAAQPVSGMRRSQIHSNNPSPRSASQKLAFTLRSFSFKKREEARDTGEEEHLQPEQDDPYQDLETAYVAHVCLTWEALHCQYTQLHHTISSDPENPTCYSHSAQLFQQFQVLLQRFIENEPFEQGLRAEVFARTRNAFTKLLQVPNIQDTDKKERVNVEVEDPEEPDAPVLASDLIKIIEDSILTFLLFLKMDKKKPAKILNLFGGQNQNASPLQQIQSSLDKKGSKLKELSKKKKGLKKKTWPTTMEEVELMFGLIDIKVISRVLRMVRVTKEQLLWCEEKLKQLDVSESKLKRDGAPILFPC